MCSAADLLGDGPCALWMSSVRCAAIEADIVYANHDERKEKPPSI